MPIVCQSWIGVVLSLGISSVRTVGRPKRLWRSEPSGSTTWPWAPIQLACRSPTRNAIAADPVAAGRGDRAVLVGRPPGDRPRGSPKMCRAASNGMKGAISAELLADEHVPADRAVEAGDLLDCLEIDPGLDLLAADRARQQQAEQAGSCSVDQQRLGDVRVRSISSTAAAIAGPSARARATGSGLRVEMPMSFMRRRMSSPCGKAVYRGK